MKKGTKKGGKTSRFRTTFRLLQRLTRIFFSLLVISLLVYSGNRFYRTLKSSSVFQVKTVSISGNHILSTGDLTYYLGLDKPVNLLNLKMGALYRKLVAHPWVKDATIHRSLPNTLSIHIEERVPVAMIMVDRLYYVDREGVVFARISKEVGCDFPIFTGPRTFSQLPAYRPLLTEALPLITEKTRQIISEIHLDLSKGVTLITLQDAIPVRLGLRNLPERLHRFLATYHYLRQREIVVKKIDCRYPDRVVVKYESSRQDKTSSGGKA